jgi:hypothetical protein
MFPDWVMKYKKKGHKIVEKNGHYYLYKSLQGESLDIKPSTDGYLQGNDY